MRNSFDNDSEDDSVLSLLEILRTGITDIAGLAEAIEKGGVWTKDRFGRLRRATGGDAKENTSKAYALDSLASYYTAERSAYKYYGPTPTPHEWSLVEQAGQPLKKFGWPKNEVPVFGKSLTDSSSNGKLPSEVIEPRNWKIEARHICQEKYAIDMQTNRPKKLEQYGEYVTQQMRDREIYSTRGKILKYSAIMRDALQGDGWWRHREKTRLGK